MTLHLSKARERFLHLLQFEDVANRPVSEFSRWADDTWRFTATTAGRKNIALHWRFEMLDGSMSTDPQWGGLLDLGRRLVWSIRVDSQRGKNMKDTSLPDFYYGVRYLLRWMARESYATFAEVDEEAAQEFCHNLAADKALTGDEDEVSANILARYLDILVRIHEQSTVFVHLPHAVMRRHPFGGRSAVDVASDLSRKAQGFIPPVPDPVFLATVKEALEWLEAPARDLRRLGHQFQAANLRSQQNSSNSYSWHLNKVLERFTFNDNGALAEPWHPGLRGTLTEKRWLARLGGYIERERSPIQRYRRLLLDLRDACVIVVQSTVGMRISEIAGLRAGPADRIGDWPPCVEVRTSISGLNEIFYIKGRLFKQRDQWDEVEWVAGSRPRGTDYVPPPVRALGVLDHLYAPWRDLAGSNDLIVSLGKIQGMPRQGETLNPVLSDSLRDGQKEFVREYVHLPPEYKNWNLTTHQWRKSFCLYIVRSDERLLPAVSDHFKHMSIAMTEQGYLGNDPELLGLMEDVATREAARFLFEAVNGTTAFAGKMAEKVEAQAPQIRALIGDEGTDAQKIERLTETLRDDDLRVWPADWGKCFFRPETSRCHFDANGAFNLEARRPHYGQRRAGLCCDCSNLLVSDAHAEFWIRRHADNQLLRQENAAAGEHATAAIAAERARKSAAILRKMNIIVDAINDREQHVETA